MAKYKIKKFSTPYYLVFRGKTAIAKTETLGEAKRIKKKKENLD